MILTEAEVFAGRLFFPPRRASEEEKGSVELRGDLVFADHRKGDTVHLCQACAVDVLEKNQVIARRVRETD